MAVPVPSMSCCVLNHHNLFYQIQNALAFNRDTCCYLALCLRLLPFHWLWLWVKITPAYCVVVAIKIQKVLCGWSQTSFPAKVVDGVGFAVVDADDHQVSTRKKIFVGDTLGSGSFGRKPFGRKSAWLLQLSPEHLANRHLVERHLVSRH